jgi:hypothetical protein
MERAARAFKSGGPPPNWNPSAGGAQASRQQAAQAQTAATAATAAAAAAVGQAVGAVAGTAAAPLVQIPGQPRGRAATPGSGPALLGPPTAGGGGGGAVMPYIYQGTIIPPSVAGGAAAAWAGGQTINGTATYPGGAGGGGGGGPQGPGASPPYGPYGPRVNVGARGVGAYTGGAGGGGGGQIPLNLPPNPTPGYQYTPGRSPMAGIQGLSMSGGLLDYAGYQWFKENWEKAAHFRAEQAALTAQGFTPEETSRAGQLAMGLQQKVGAIDPQAALHLIDKLMNVTQDKSVALNEKLLEQYAKTSVVLSAYGHGDTLKELDSAIRAGEFRGVLSHEGKDGKQEIDIAGLTQFLRQLEAMNAVSGGDINPSKMLANLRSSGVAGTLTSSDEMTRQMAMIIASGQFKAGSMSEAAANMLIRMGIIKGGGTAKHNPYLEKSGVGAFIMHPGAMPPGMTEMARSDPSLFIMQHLLPKIQGEIRKTYGSRYDLADEKGKLGYEAAFASSIASRMGGGVEMVEVIRNTLLMQRDLEAVKGALGRDLYANQAQNNPLFVSKSLGAANQAMGITLGEATMKPATDALNLLVGVLNNITAWAHDHGPETKLGLEMLAGGLVALGAAGIVGLATTMGGLTGAFMALGAATIYITDKVQGLDRYLHTAFGGLIGTSEENAKAQQSIKEHGVQLPWWAPMPAGPGGRADAPSWFKSLNPFSSAAAAPGAAPTAQERSVAPTGVFGSDKGSASNPVNVIVQNQISEAGIARGVSSSQARQFNRPPAGVSGPDPRVDPLGMFQGMVGP